MTITYAERLSTDLSAALMEGSLHFEGQSAVFQSLREITRRLDQLQVPYAVAGGMALFAHGFRRFTEDVDLIVTPGGLAQVHANLDGRGYVPPFAGSRHLRDGQTKVRIEFLVTGQYPGDGKPKPVAFPDPAKVSVEIDGVRYLNLPTLVDLKLASGMTGGVGRLKDLADVAELIRLLALPATFAEQLAPYTRDKFAELWTGLQASAPGHEAE